MCYIKQFQETVLFKEKTQWPNLTALFALPSLIDYNNYEAIENLSPHQSEILAILDRYLSDLKTIPPEEVVEATYTKIVGLFQLATQSPAAHTSSTESNCYDIDTKFLNYMVNLAHEISKSQTASCHKEVPCQIVDENAAENIPNYPIYNLR